MRPPACLLVTLLCLLPSATPSTAAEAAPAAASARNRVTIDCQALARMKNAPMNVADCEARLAAQHSLETALSAGAEASRPGDASMGCPDIIAEMQSLTFSGIDPDRAEAMRAAGNDLRATYEGHQAAAAALATRQSAITAASMLAPNAVQAAVGASLETERRALSERAVSDMQRSRGHAEQAIATGMNDLATNLRNHPRFARLMQLVQEKNCRFEDAPPGAR